MTTDELIMAVSLAIDDDRADKTQIAQTMINLAAQKLGRVKYSAINRTQKTITLTSGRSEYIVGQDLFVDDPGVINVQSMWRTDVAGWEVEIKDLPDFQACTSGLEGSGAPRLATIFGAGGELTKMKFHPTPDSNYSLDTQVQTIPNGIQDIDDNYYDTIYVLAIELIQASKSSTVAIELARTGLADIRADSKTGWNGTTIKTANNLGDQRSGLKKTDSRDVR